MDKLILPYKKLLQLSFYFSQEDCKTH